MKPIYLLDTCIISEPAKPKPERAVIEKIGKYADLSAIAALVWHELLFGMNRIPDGKRKKKINAFILDVVAPNFAIIAYDERAAWIHASIRADLERRGTTLSFADGIVVSTAIANNMILVTRNTKDFESIDHLMMENWFSSQHSRRL